MNIKGSTHIYTGKFQGRQLLSIPSQLFTSPIFTLGMLKAEIYNEG